MVYIYINLNPELFIVFFSLSICTCMWVNRGQVATENFRILKKNAVSRVTEQHQDITNHSKTKHINNTV